MKKPLIVAHRGASGHAPENTMAAFREAIAMKADGIETDLHVSRDGHFVAIHDPTLQRTTNGRGRVSDYSLNELQQLEAGLWFDRSFAGERIPTLDQILAFAEATSVHLFLELKYAHDVSLHRALVKSIEEKDAISRATIISFDSTSVQFVHEMDRALSVGLLSESRTPDPVEMAAALGLKYVCPRNDLITRTLVERANLAGLQVATWTVDRLEHMKSIITAGVDAIMTDFPDRLMAAIAECTTDKAK